MYLSAMDSEDNQGSVWDMEVQEGVTAGDSIKEAAQQYVVLAKLQYINGVIRYIDVLDAQRKFFDAQVEESKAVRNEHLALVGLYKALGGGWQPSDAEKKG